MNEQDLDNSLRNEKDCIQKLEELDYYQNFDVEQISLYKLTIKGIDSKFVIENLTMNGTNYVSENEIDTNKWPEFFELIVESNDGNTVCYNHAKLVQQIKYNWDNKYYLAFAQVSEQEIKNMKLESNIEYISMMADIDIE